MCFPFVDSSNYYVQVQTARLASLDEWDKKTKQNSSIQNKLPALQSQDFTLHLTCCEGVKDKGKSITRHDVEGTFKSSETPQVSLEEQIQTHTEKSSSHILFTRNSDETVVSESTAQKQTSL